MKILVIGCGGSPYRFVTEGQHQITTLDNNPSHQPDVLHDLNTIPLPFENDSFDQIHASHVLEHCGVQGDAKFFFNQFADFWRILKPNGVLIAAVPMWNNMWAWGDPSHTRVISEGSLVFLDQANYSQVGKTVMSDFRHMYDADFKVTDKLVREDEFCFTLRANK